MWLGSERLFDVALVGGEVLGIDGIDRHAIGGERGAHVITCREGIGGAQGDLCTASLECAQQAGCLGRDMQRSSYALALKRTFDSEFTANLAQHGHVALGPGDALASTVGEGEVSNVVVHGQFSFMDYYCNNQAMRLSALRLQRRCCLLSSQATQSRALPCRSASVEVTSTGDSAGAWRAK